MISAAPLEFSSGSLCVNRYLLEKVVTGCKDRDYSAIINSSVHRLSSLCFQAFFLFTVFILVNFS